MAEPVIKVSGLGKEYRIGAARDRRRSFREALTDFLPSLLSPVSGPTDAIWALRDVNFEIARGEVVGVIGRNGAGKSTLLKILSQITYPTEGRVEIRGRVASLLEVGTGFHPELTGRENIFLNGAILGMTRAEMMRKFDSIVEFAGVRKFIDTPVKRYSSGMQVRLAFAVAAHIEPEILLVDEVLAVGDIEFQRKCIGKMNDISHEEGRTILFVSHNMTAVESLCSRCILIDSGKIAVDGKPSEVIGKYQETVMKTCDGTADLTRHPGRTAKSMRLLTKAIILDGNGRQVSAFRMGEDLTVKVNFDSAPDATRPVLRVMVKTILGAPVFSVDNRVVPGYRPAMDMKSGAITCRIASPPLMPGSYLMDILLGNDQHFLDTIIGAMSFEVLPADVFGTGRLPPAHGGSVYLSGAWTFSDSADVPVGLE